MTCRVGLIFADFIQQQRTAVDGFEQALAILDGAGERATFVTKQFALQQGFGQRPAILLDEQFVLSRAARVNMMGQQVLPVPVSPVSSTVAELSITLSSRLKTRRMAGLCLTTVFVKPNSLSVSFSITGFQPSGARWRPAIP